MEPNVFKKCASLYEQDKQYVRNVNVAWKLTRQRIQRSYLGDKSELEPLETFVLASGSSLEGAALCRIICGPHVDPEVDEMFQICNFADNDKFVHAITSKPGFYTIHIDKEELLNTAVYCAKLKKYLREQVKIDENKILESGQLRCMLASEIQNYLKIQRSVLNIVFENYIQYIVKKCPKTDIGLSYSGPSVVLDFTFYGDGEVYGKLSMDQVCAIKILNWPNEASEWITRPRLWPSKEDVCNIVQHGWHLVSKEEVAWRASFTTAEIMLSELRTRNMGIMYLLYKLIFYFHIKIIEVNAEHIPSYVVKTVMMWYQEKQPATKWREENTPEILHELFAGLHEGLSTGRIESYFIPALNIIENKPRALLLEAAAKAKEISENPLEYVNDCFQKIDYENLDKILHLTDTLAKIAEKNTKTMVKMCLANFGFKLRNRMCCYNKISPQPTEYFGLLSEVGVSRTDTIEDVVTHF